MMTTNSNRSSTTPVQNPVASVASRVADVAGDFVELAELQTHLTACDCKNLLQSAKPAIIGTVFGLTLVLPALTIMLMAASEGIAEQYLLSKWLSQLIISSAALLVAAFFVALSMRRMRSAMSNLNSSMQQLKENIVWIKSVFRG